MRPQRDKGTQRHWSHAVSHRVWLPGRRTGVPDIQSSAYSDGASPCRWSRRCRRRPARSCGTARHRRALLRGALLGTAPPCATDPWREARHTARTGTPVHRAAAPTAAVVPCAPTPAAVAPAVLTTAAPPASQVAGMVTRWARRGEPQPASFLFDRGEAADVACKKSAVQDSRVCDVEMCDVWSATHERQIQA
jgi:hypothetical protein